MATYSVSCPQCHAALRAARPFPPSKQVRCPQCGGHFVAADHAALDGTKRDRKKLILLACAAALLVVGVSVGATILIVGRQTATEPGAKDEQVRKLQEQVQAMKADQEKRQKLDQLMQKGTEALGKKQYAEAMQAYTEALSLFPTDPAVRDGLLKQVQAMKDDQDKHEKLDQLKQKGKEALDKKQYAEAKQAYAEAFKLFPNDPEVLNGLLSTATPLVKTDEPKKVDAPKEDDPQAKQKEYDRRMGEGQQAKDGKNYVVATLSFEAALAAKPGDAAAQKALDDVKVLIATDKMEKQVLADFRTHMDLAQAAMVRQDFRTALNEYTVAKNIVPNAEALKGIAAAQAGLDALQGAAKNQGEAQRLVEKGREGLRRQRFGDAIGNFQAALNLVPGDPNAKLGMDEAVKARNLARADYTKYMTQAATAVQLKDYPSSLLAYQAALQIIPNDADAAAGIRDVQFAIAQTQVAVLNLPALLAQGQEALIAKRYDIALNLFNQALQIAPTDLTALAGQREATLRLGRRVEKAVDFEQIVAQGNAALQKTKYLDAIRLFADALRIHPASQLAKDGLRRARYGKDMADGRQALNVRKYKDAVTFFEAALREQPADNQAMLWLNNARQLAAGKK